MTKVLTRLYAHEQGALKELENFRINPDFSVDVRIDLEFYIPQVLTFFL